jgi:hypothetical protein
MWALVEEGLIDRFYKNSKVKKSLPKIVKSVKKGKTGPTVAAHKLLYLHDQCFSEPE